MGSLLQEADRFTPDDVEPMICDIVVSLRLASMVMNSVLNAAFADIKAKNMALGIMGQVLFSRFRSLKPTNA